VPLRPGFVFTPSLKPGAAAEPFPSSTGWHERERVVDPVREADRALLARYSPAGVLVNSEWEILQFRGDTGPYLAPGPGRPSLSMLKMAREGLLVSLRTALYRAKKEDAPVREQDVHVKSNGGFRAVHVQVLPVRSGSARERTYLVLFEEAAPHPPPPEGDGGSGKQDAVTQAEREEKDRLNARLTQQLNATREYLQSVIEQQEAANEELQSANEEVQSINEELQSTNEELETSKEEIESSNEELTTVNEELQNRIAELNRVNDDMSNLLA